MEIWFLAGVILVFFMQCGFTMVEAGFTRAKNAGNIIMKNLMDFCMGTIAFIAIGYGILCSSDSLGEFMGLPNYEILTNFSGANWSAFVFNLVFCATAATIVSGAMAERTKFSSYLLYSIIISAIVYPIEAFWVWGSNGWLINRGFIDFAGSAAIHTVGGIAGLIGAIFLGPRIGKYVTGADGKKEARAIPGHSLTLGALGVFILWFGWYGFNGAAAGDAVQLAEIFGTTTIAAAMGATGAMLFSWGKNGAPDVSLTLNGALAGLVGITAGCASVDAIGAIIIGLVAGFLVVIVVEFVDIKLHIDDPVGAFAVHGACGIWGTIAVGLFAYDGGVFYGGGMDLLKIQVIGIVAIAAWTTITMTAVFYILNKTIGLRVTAEEEIAGLDSCEHGLASAYADFIPMMHEEFGEKSMAESVPVVLKESAPEHKDKKMTKVEIVTDQGRLDSLKTALEKIGVTGMTVSQVMGCGTQKGADKTYRGVKVGMTLLPKMQVSIVVSKVPVEDVITAARKALYTGNIGDGKIFVYGIDNVVRIRTGESGYEALQ